MKYFITYTVDPGDEPTYIITHLTKRNGRLAMFDSLEDARKSASDYRSLNPDLVDYKIHTR